MIESFNHKGLKRLYENNDRKLIRPDLVERVSVILAYLDAAKVIGELDLPTLRLHPLKGGLKGFWSIRVSGSSECPPPVRKRRADNPVSAKNSFCGEFRAIAWSIASFGNRTACSSPESNSMVNELMDAARWIRARS